MTKLGKLAVVVGSYAGVLALTGTALADTTVSAAVGPVPIPNVPVEVCITQTDFWYPIDECATIPAGGESISLKVVVHVKTPVAVVVPPAVTPIPCPAGTQGVAAQVFTGSAQATVGGFATVVWNDGTPVTVPIGQVVAAAGQTLTVFASAGLSPGAPLPAVPAL